MDKYESKGGMKLTAMSKICMKTGETYNSKLF